MARKKYATLAELKAAYDTGELTAETAVAELDKNEVYVTWHDPADEDWLHAEDIYGDDMCTALEQALDLLGIPWMHG